MSSDSFGQRQKIYKPTPSATVDPLTRNTGAPYFDIDSTPVSWGSLVRKYGASEMAPGAKASSWPDMMTFSRLKTAPVTYGVGHYLGHHLLQRGH
jgi:hypothetical protein